MAIGARLRGILDELIATGYPEQVAERIASGDLPMDTASRMQRAEAMGFDPTDVQYHGTEADITSFIPSLSGKMGPGVYTTPSQSTANTFSGYPSPYAEGGNVMPLLTRGNYIDNADAFNMRPDISGKEGQRILNEALQEAGYAGRQAGGRGLLTGERVTFDPSNVRSLFAAFDPEYKGSNILGERAIPVAGAGLLAAAAMSPEEAEAGPLSAAARAAQQGFTNKQYHASMQDFDRIVPGYDDGLFFTTPNPEFASDWAGKGKLQNREGELDSYDRYRPQKQKLYEEMGSPEFGTPEYDEFVNRSAEIYRQEQNAFKTIYPVLARTEKTFDPEKNFDDIADLFDEGRLKAPFSAEYPTYADALKGGNYMLYENPEVVRHLKNKGYDSMFLRESTGSKEAREAPYTTVAHFYPDRNIRSQFAEFAEGYTGPNILGSTAAGALGLTALMAPEEAEAAMSGKVIRGLFDMSELEQVPDVPQFALERYNPPRGRPANLDDILTPETAARLQEYAKIGEQAGGRSWYNTDPLRQSFIDELGEEAGAADYNRFMDMVAATSPRSRVDSNIRRASYFRQLDKQGEQFADLANPDLPQGYGHLAHETQNALLRDLAQGGSFAALNRPKVSSFAENLKGNQAPMTIDTHNFSAVTGDFKTKKSPAKTQYRYLEEFQSEIADKMNMTPAQFQASVWMGAGTGVADSRPFMEVFDDVVERTAKRDDKSKESVLKDFIQGKAPLFSMAGGAALATGSIMSPQQAQAMQEFENTAARIRAENDTSGMYAPRSETLQDVTMALRGLERRLEGNPASLLFPSGYVQHLEEFNRPYERSTLTGALLGALDFL